MCNSHSNHQLIRFLLFIYVVIILSLSLQFPFFTDGVALASRVALYFYMPHSTPPLILPTAIDTGHPPFFGLYLCTIWQLWGKSLWISHLALLPFLILIWTYFYTLLRQITPQYIHYALLLLALEPTLLAQSCSISTEVPLTAGFAGCLYALLTYNRRYLGLFSLLMVAVSLRGVLIMFGFILFDIVTLAYAAYKQHPTLSLSAIRISLKPLLDWLPPLLFLGIWWVYHYYYTGFVVINYNNNWADNYTYNSPQQYLYYMAICIWRLIDQGRIVIWGIVALLLWQYRQRKQPLPYTAIRLIQIMTCVALTVIPTLCLRQTSILHRYFLPFSISLIILVVILLPILSRTWQRITVFTISCCLLSAHFWSYPPPIANGWEATLAYIPTFELMDNVRRDIVDQGIFPPQCATGFPIEKSLYETNLEELDKVGIGAAFANFKRQPSLRQCHYVLYSNLCNDFNASQLHILAQDFEVCQHWQKGQIYMVLYENKNDAH